MRLVARNNVLEVVSIQIGQCEWTWDGMKTQPFLAPAMLVLLGLGGCAQEPTHQTPQGPSLEAVFLDPHWVPGPVKIQGTVANRSMLNTTAGVAQVVRLVQPSRSAYKEDLYTLRGSELAGRVGQNVNVTLHFQKINYDGATAVMAPELVGLFPSLHQKIARLVDSVSGITAGRLVLQGTKDGWSTYLVETSHGETIPPSALTPRISEIHGDRHALDSVATWVSSYANLFVNVTREAGNGWDSSDGPAWSAANFSWSDQDADGLVGDGDLVRVRYPPQPASTYQPYLLGLGDCRLGCVAGLKLALVGPDGAQPELLRTGPYIDVRQSRHGNEAEWRVVRVSAGLRFDDLMFLDSQGSIVGRLTVRLTLGNVTYSPSDRSEDGLVDVGDGFLFSGPSAETERGVTIHHTPSGNVVLKLAWNSAGRVWPDT